ncbi:hypothetical protein SESBI_41621 [Sesbania bispinosa]|nr:hypothetical protein SESBI_41621 [Sesbania bispinosa]
MKQAYLQVDLLYASHVGKTHSFAEATTTVESPSVAATIGFSASSICLCSKAPVFTKSSPKIPPPSVSFPFTDLYFVADISEDSTTKLEWKSSPDPFIFGDFGFKSKKTSEVLVMASSNSCSEGKISLQNSDFEMKLMQIDGEDLGIPEAENDVSENAATAMLFVTVKPQLLVKALKTNDATFGAEEVGRTLNLKRKPGQELLLILSVDAEHEDDFIRPWESKNLFAVSSAIQDWLISRIAMELMQQGAMMTVLSALVTALAWPVALLAATDFIDNTWVEHVYAVEYSHMADMAKEIVETNGYSNGVTVLKGKIE